MVERLIDLIALVVALVLVVAVFGSQLYSISELLWSNLRSVAASAPIGFWPAVTGALAVALGAGLLLRRWSRAPDGSNSRMLIALRSFRDGLASLVLVRQRLRVAAATFGIWFCYVLMADFPLRMLGLSERYGLGLMDSVALMSVGAIGMAIPSPGGAGSFHYITVQTLLHLFAVSITAAATYAIVAHAAQLLLVCVVGFACLILQGTSLRSLRRHAGTPAAIAPPTA